MPFSAIFHAARRPADARRTLLAHLLIPLLIAAMLCSHWQGLAHRISHASRVLGTADAVQLVVASAVTGGDLAQKNADQSSANHSCLAFDAASVGAALCGTPFTAVLHPAQPVLQAWIAFISYLAPLTPHFSSRAPPLP